MAILYPVTPQGVLRWQADLHAKEPTWWLDLDNQCEVLFTVSHFEDLITTIQTGPLVKLFNSRTGIPLPRVEAIFKLAKVEDQRRAIKWPGPTPLDRSEPHTDLYPTTGWIGEYLLYSQGSEIPMAWHFWFAVALIGAACRRNLYIDMGTFCVYSYWYLMIIEETASAKSTAFGIAKDMLRRMNRQLDQEARQDRIVKIAAQSATLPAFLDEIKTDAIMLPVQGSSIPRVAKLESSSVLAVDELVSLLGKTKHNSEEWVGFLTDIFGYPDDDWTDNKVTQGRTRKLYRPSISFLGGSTMDWIKSSVTDDMFQGGFLGRFVFIKRRGDGKEVDRPAILDPVWAENLATYLGSLAKMDVSEFKLTPEAWAWEKAWYHENKSKTKRWEGDPKFQAYWRRKQSHFLRLAMCMCVAKGQFYCEVADLELAQTLLSIEEESMSWIFSDLGSHPDKALCDYLVRVIGKDRTWVGYSKLLRDTRHRLGNSERTKQLLATLVSAGEIEWTKTPKGGMQYRVAEKPTGGVELVTPLRNL